jgi:hypothetical protein
MKNGTQAFFGANFSKLPPFKEFGVILPLIWPMGVVQPPPWIVGVAHHPQSSQMEMEVAKPPQMAHGVAIATPFFFWFLFVCFFQKHRDNYLFSLIFVRENKNYKQSEYIKIFRNLVKVHCQF